MLNSSVNTPTVKSLFGKPIELTNYSQSLIRLRAYQDSNTFTLYSDIYFPKKATFLLLEPPNQPVLGLVGPTFTIGALYNDTYQFLFSDVISPTTTSGANELLNILYGWLGLVSGISINGGSTNGLLNTINLIPGTNITINGVSDPINNQYDITISSTGSSGTVTSVSASVPSPASPAFSVAVTNPTTTPVIAISANGATSQYVRGDGSLATFPTVTPSALTKTDDTNVTLTLGGSPSTALLAATSITVGWSGTLGISRGGTGIATTPINGQLLIGNGTGYNQSTITGGSGINITNGPGTITITNTGVIEDPFPKILMLMGG